MPDDRQPWFVVVDPQRIFADPTSEWGSPMFDDALAPIKSLRSSFGAGRTIVTRWVPGSERPGSWGPYFERWSFADRPATDPLFDLVSPANGWSSRGTVDVSTFGKWGEGITRTTGGRSATKSAAERARATRSTLTTVGGIIRCSPAATSSSSASGSTQTDRSASVVASSGIWPTSFPL